MSRRPRRKQTGVIGTLLVELSALAGIFGIAQPTLQENLWMMFHRVAIDSPTIQPEPQEFREFESQPESYLSTHPSAYTAQALIPHGSSRQSVLNAAGYNPMGNYQ